MHEFTVLHVEDEPSDRMIVASAFRKTAPHVELRSVEDGEQAVAYLTGEDRFADRAAFPPPQLILLDLKLPRRSGFEVLEWVRNQSENKQVPVIILTSSAESVDVDRAFALGATSYIVKSVDLAEMREIVRGIGDYATVLTRSSARPGP